jgi:hypothetical protein
MGKMLMKATYPTAETLVAQASQNTGLTDFGPGGFREGLDRLLESLRDDAGLSEQAAAGVTPLLVKRLVNRLLIERWFAANSDAAQVPIASPISIMGLPRTGTTALANMMSLDPQFRCLRPWEQAEPCPPPVLATEATDPRRVSHVAGLEAMARNRPDLMAMHLFDADATVEDTEVLGLDFAAQQAVWPVFGYQAWYRDRDMRGTFAYHRRVMQMLQSSRPPNRWLFKAPHHKFHLEAVASAYPDIRFIFTHRDPAKAVPSYASFISSLYPAGAADEIGRETIGRRVHEHLLIGMHRAVEARSRLGEHRFIDVQQHEIDRAPIQTLQRIYAGLGLELTGEVIDAVRRWGERNSSGAHGTHRYTPEQFGLSVDHIRSDYDFYIRAFDISVAG